jgi:hypothetical protein
VRQTCTWGICSAIQFARISVDLCIPPVPTSVSYSPDALPRFVEIIEQANGRRYCVPRGSAICLFVLDLPCVLRLSRLKLCGWRSAICICQLQRRMLQSLTSMRGSCTIRVSRRSPRGTPHLVDCVAKQCFALQRVGKTSKARRDLRRLLGEQPSRLSRSRRNAADATQDFCRRQSGGAFNVGGDVDPAQPRIQDIVTYLA